MVTKIPEGSQEVIEILVDDQMYTLDDLNTIIPNLELGTIRYAIRRLLEIGIIQSIPDLQDMRTVKYRLENDTNLSNNLAKLPPDILIEIQHLFTK